MNGQVIPFPSGGRRRSDPNVEPNPFTFWVEILDDLPPQERRATIAAALYHGVVNDRDAVILRTLWLDREAT